MHTLHPCASGGGHAQAAPLCIRACVAMHWLPATSSRHKLPFRSWPPGGSLCPSPPPVPQLWPPVASSHHLPLCSPPQIVPLACPYPTSLQPAAAPRAARLMVLSCAGVQWMARGGAARLVSCSLAVEAWTRARGSVADCVLLACLVSLLTCWLFGGIHLMEDCLVQAWSNRLHALDSSES